MENDVLYFDGDQIINLQSAGNLTNTFTYEFWVKADAEQRLGTEEVIGTDGINGKRYLVAPIFHGNGASGFGIAIGTNGISIHEHSVNHIPARLVHKFDFSQWQHVAIVSEQKKIQLYLNGVWIKVSTVSIMETIIPSLTLGGHQYGTFKGQVKQFRLWSVARTDLEIQAYMNTNLVGTEQGLYYYRDPSKGVVVSNGMLRNIQVSVVIPTYNRFQLTHFTLESLNRQYYPMEQIEVVLLDDHSTDSTAEVVHLICPAYSFIFVQSLVNRGRAKIRNIGASISSGSTFVFIDGDIICAPDFIRNHMRHHQQGREKVVSGAMRSKRIYTQFDPSYSEAQIKQLKLFFSDNNRIRSDLEKRLKEDRVDVKPFQLLSLNQILDITELNRWSRPLVYYEPVLQKHGDRFEGFHYSWVSVITNNISLDKKLFYRIGGFDEAFEGFGWEDWELGYRAERGKAIIIHDDSVINYHQEHPISVHNVMESRRNYLIFCNKYPDDMRIKLLGLVIIEDGITLVEANEMWIEYEQFRQLYSKTYTHFLPLINKALVRLSERLPVHQDRDLTITGNLTCEVERAYAQHEVEVIRNLPFPKLLGLYERLTRKL